MQECFEILSSYSLIKQQWTDGRFWMHPVVHKWARVLQNTDELSRRSAGVLRGLHSFFSPVYAARTQYLAEDILSHSNFFVLQALPCLEPQAIANQQYLFTLIRLYYIATEEGSWKIAGIACLKALDSCRYFQPAVMELFNLYVTLSRCLEVSGWRSVAEALRNAGDDLVKQKSEYELFFLLSSAERDYARGHLTKAENECRKFLITLQRTTEGEDLTESALQVEWLLAKILMQHKAGPRFLEGISIGNLLARRIIETNLHVEYPGTLEIVAEIGEYLEASGQPHDAHIFYDNAITLMIKIRTPRERVGKWLRKLTNLLFSIGEFCEAETSIRLLLKIVPATKPGEKRDLLSQLIFCLRKQENYEELESVARQLLESEREAISDSGDSGHIIKPTVHLCSALMLTGRSSEAVSAAEESLAFHQQFASTSERSTAYLRTFLEELRKGKLPRCLLEP